MSFTLILIFKRCYCLSLCPTVLMSKHKSLASGMAPPRDPSPATSSQSSPSRASIGPSRLGPHAYQQVDDPVRITPNPRPQMGTTRHTQPAIVQRGFPGSPRYTQYSSPSSIGPSPSVGYPSSVPSQGYFGVYPGPFPHPPSPSPELNINLDEVALPIKQPPRPPNAWILYRSDKLKAIAGGEQVADLDAIMAESGVSSTSSSEGDVKVAKVKRKKGSKEPTEGMLALGRGKTGRGLPQADISKMISMMWKRERPEVRAQYEHLSEMRKLEVRATSRPGLIAASREISGLQV